MARRIQSKPTQGRIEVRVVEIENYDRMVTVVAREDGSVIDLTVCKGAFVRVRPYPGMTVSARNSFTYAVMSAGARGVKALPTPSVESPVSMAAAGPQRPTDDRRSMRVIAMDRLRRAQNVPDLVLAVEAMDEALSRAGL